MLQPPCCNGAAWRLKTMDLFGMKFSIALGAWRLRFVLMLEDAEAVQKQPQAAPSPRMASMHSLMN